MTLNPQHLQLLIVTFYLRTVALPESTTPGSLGVVLHSIRGQTLYHPVRSDPRFNEKVRCRWGGANAVTPELHPRGSGTSGCQNAVIYRSPDGTTLPTRPSRNQLLYISSSLLGSSCWRDMDKRDLAIIIIFYGFVATLCGSLHLRIRGYDHARANPYRVCGESTGLTMN